MTRKVDIVVEERGYTYMRLYVPFLRQGKRSLAELGDIFGAIQWGFQAGKIPLRKSRLQRQLNRRRNLGCLGRIRRWQRRSRILGIGGFYRSAIFLISEGVWI